MYIIYMVVVGIWSCLVYKKIKNKSRSSRHRCLRCFSHRQDGISDYIHHRQSTHHHSSGRTTLTLSKCIGIRQQGRTSIAIVQLLFTFLFCFFVSNLPRSSFSMEEASLFSRPVLWNFVEQIS